jgi:Flp pilus assembly protein TadG
MALAKTRVQNLFGPRSESGTAAIEFALFVPVFLILLTGTIELGRAVYEAMQVNNAVEAGMLYVAKTGAFDSAAIATAVVNAGAVYPVAVTATPAPTQFCGCPAAADISVVNEGACAVPLATCADGVTKAGQYARINATLPHLTILPESAFPIPANFTAQAIVRIK